MPFPPGNEIYNVDCEPVRARGQQFDEDALADGAAEAVADVIHDPTGETEDRNFLASIEGSGFDDERIDEVLESADVEEELERWRAGEAIAQAELEANRECAFPWSARRDLKNPAASPAGAELVGFQARPDGLTFAFGEVKTSISQQYPPSVTTDLRRQLSELRDDPAVVANLVRYLTPRARGATWEGEFRTAFAAYSASRDHYSIFGVLVREVAPDERDLKGMAEDFAPGTKEPKTLELRAMYFPTDSVVKLAQVAA